MTAKLDLSAAMDELTQTALAVRDERNRFRNALVAILEECEDREDIEDGEGGPIPNIFMRLAETCRAALKR